MFEHKSQRLLPWPKFVGRMALTFLVAAGIVAVALMIGVLGYHYIVRLAWIDAVLNAAMILTGMGPVATMENTPSKLFAAAYALFSGVVFLSAVGIVLSPVFHRILHRFHLDEEDGRTIRNDGQSGGAAVDKSAFSEENRLIRSQGHK